MILQLHCCQCLVPRLRISKCLPGILRGEERGVPDALPCAGEEAEEFIGMPSRSCCSTARSMRLSVLLCRWFMPGKWSCSALELVMLYLTRDMSVGDRPIELVVVTGQ